MTKPSWNKDAGRAELITRFFCAECNKPLNVSYAQPDINSSYVDGDATGAAVRYNPISIWPCMRCIEKHTAPAQAIANAIRQMQEQE